MMVDETGDYVTRRAARIQIGTGDYVTVSKKRRKHSENVDSYSYYEEPSSTDEAYGTATTLAPQKKISLFTLSQPVDFIGTGILVNPLYLIGGTITAGIFSYKRWKTGDWLDWASVGHTDGRGRRSVITNEAQLDRIAQMSCQECGYTIFPAMGRNWRYFDKKQRCPLCGSVDFYDKNDPEDPRNIAEDGENLAMGRRKEMTKWILADAEKVAELTSEARAVDNMKRTEYNREADVGQDAGKAGGIRNGPIRLSNDDYEMSLAQQLAAAGAANQPAELIEEAFTGVDPEAESKEE